MTDFEKLSLKLLRDRYTLKIWKDTINDKISFLVTDQDGVIKHRILVRDNACFLESTLAELRKITS